MFKNGAGKQFSAALCIFGAVVLTILAQTTNVVPCSDDFESYTNRTPLIDGTNGWYASSNNVIVQTNIVWTNSGGAKAAMIPPSSFLSNRFVQVDNSNIWVSMRVQPCLGLFENPPTNATAYFGIGTNGYCQVYNGNNGWTNFSTAIDGSAVTAISNGEWARFDLRLNHSNKTWALFANYQLLSTNIAFATNCSLFSGFDVQGVDDVDTNYVTPSTTNYLDNVSVSYLYPPDLPAQTNSWCPVMAPVDVTNVSRIIWEGQNAASNSFCVQRSSGFLPMVFTNIVTYAAGTNWLSVIPANDTSHGERRTAWLEFNTVNLPVSNQAYQATVRIEGSDEFFGISASNSPQYITVSLYVRDAPKLSVAPLYLTNSVTVGHRATGQYFYVANTSPTQRAAMAYSVSSETNWITVSPTNGSVVDETNSIALTYPTEGLTPGWYTGIVNVTASGITNQDVQVKMRVNQTPVLTNSMPASWTNVIIEGETLAGTNFHVWNSSAAPTGTMKFAVSADAGWLNLSPASGISSGERQSVAVVYSVSSLPPGEYLSTITLEGQDASTGDAAANSPLTMVARLTVLEKATLVTDVISLSNSVLENCNATSPAAFHIWDGAGIPPRGLNYTISSQDNWLKVSPASGTLTNNTKEAITVIWTPGDLNLATGIYNGSIIVDGTYAYGHTVIRASGAPKTINVQMTVLSRTPVNYEKPTIYGTPYIGQTLTAGNGLWQNIDRLTFTYQWQRANSAAGPAANISGQIASNYVVAVADRGKYMRIAVTATDANPTRLSTKAYSDLVPSAKIKAAPGDFGPTNGDGITDLWFFDPSDGMWRASFTGNSFAEGLFGSAGMMDVPGDYNGDGIMDLGVYDSAHGMWYLFYMPSGPALNGSMFGGITEETQATPVPDDYDGDGQTDVALYWRGYWAILYSTLHRIVVVEPIAGAEAAPAPADYDGDGIADLAVYDAGLWTIRNNLGQKWSVQFGSSAWLPAPGDYDGDNITDLGIFNQASNVWSMLYSSSGTTTNAMIPSAPRSFGSSLGANLPCQGYYDHDAYCDPATIHYSADGDFVIWCVTRSIYANSPYKWINGQTYQKSINDWRVSW